MRNRRGERIAARDQRDANSPALKSFNGGAGHSLENPSDTHHLSEKRVGKYVQCTAQNVLLSRNTSDAVTCGQYQIASDSYVRSLRDAVKITKRRQYALQII